MQYGNTCEHELYPIFIYTLYYVLYLELVQFFLVISSYGKSFDHLFTLLFTVSARE